MDNLGNTKDKISSTLKKIGDFMNLECQIDLQETLSQEGKAVTVAMNIPEDARFLIGKNGQNLKALEHILKAMFLKDGADIRTINVDVNDYKKSRATYLVELARQTVMRVRSTQKAEALTPMTAYERRVVHMELASYPDIATESIGTEPQRRIVIKPYP